MKELQPSGFGIVVDKSKATKTFPMKLSKYPPTRSQQRELIEIRQHNQECREQVRKGEAIMTKNLFHALWLALWSSIPVFYEKEMTLKHY